MKTRPWLRAAIVWSAVLAMPACALLTKSAPLVPRYFTPDIAAPRPKSDARPSDRRLRLGRIQAALHLRERMAYRTSGEELGYYNDRRWTERPESFLRRALSRSLFEARGVTRVVSGEAPTLDAELVAFEEIKDGDHRVCVQIVMSLDDGRVGAVERTITVERKVAGNNEEDPKPVVKEFARALSEAVEQISDQVVLAGFDVAREPAPAR